MPGRLTRVCCVQNIERRRLGVRPRNYGLFTNVYVHTHAWARSSPVRTRTGRGKPAVKPRGGRTGGTREREERRGVSGVPWRAAEKGSPGGAARTPTARHGGGRARLFHVSNRKPFAQKESPLPVWLHFFGREKKKGDDTARDLLPVRKPTTAHSTRTESGTRSVLFPTTRRTPLRAVNPEVPLRSHEEGGVEHSSIQGGARRQKIPPSSFQNTTDRNLGVLL